MNYMGTVFRGPYQYFAKSLAMPSLKRCYVHIMVSYTRRCLGTNGRHQSFMNILNQREGVDRKEVCKTRAYLESMKPMKVVRGCNS